MAGGAILLQNDKTLVDWVKEFRLKKVQMRRKARRGVEGLRICAILATALKSAEKELRQKQQERYNRWSEFQFKLVKDQNSIPSPICCSPSQIQEEEERQRHKKEVAEVWKSEISSLDEFMRNLSNSQKCVSASS
ncbi:uncharacterized protein LOC129938624 [Eupeodes corollae]|uniref:uncharacterized protein LOC129938624 n=1 Tax=Eupeodes corollae TaxID=290404 RepID=UPI0024929CB7|nr:uncharacterized protein LOC129938624 [Eupeodes corollae]